MSPSGPVSVETFPSNRTILVGVVQVCLVIEEIMFEHLLLLDDPFTATKSVSLEKKYWAGETAIIHIYYNFITYAHYCVTLWVS